MFETLGLFFGSLLDALIGPNLVVPGEPFMIAAGYQLYSGAYLAVFAVLLGGLIGDQLSFLIGRRYGFRAQKSLLRWQPKIRRPLARCRLLINRNAFWVIAFARLLGPIAWVVPFMAGANHIRWSKFSAYALIGLVLGVGQFVTWGFLLAAGVDNVPILGEAATFVSEHKYTLGLTLVSLALLYFGIKKQWRYSWLKASNLFLAGALALNYSHFFWWSDDAVVPLTQTQNVEVNLAELDYKVYAGQSTLYAAQALNVVYLGESPIKLMDELGWIQNKTFSRSDIELADYVSLLQQRTPPVSDLLWNGQPQHFAFQLPGTLTHRSHIRWWYAGIDAQTKQPVWVGALSYDDGLKLTPYGGIVTVLHSISPDVDVEREQLKTDVFRLNDRWNAENIQLASVTKNNSQHDYFTDGHVLVVSEQASYVNNLQPSESIEFITMNTQS
ncbi:LssY C-terminal domain-containing protein [Vibrio sp. SCSIO 43140]|uniref:LssY C-terminal domain-containing protein n=1 Tax=Vibrio sp. SCSIO 43140 TaxID=2819100 RepID=UPI00207638BD|nr:LssY C-terminal domain-containing protein [Vibrio sp. SCSIO 43140]USD63437.1 LssY C-terminal domain-containing protein [Vibrio sp. SCSIO 43140]